MIDPELDALRYAVRLSENALDRHRAETDHQQCLNCRGMMREDHSRMLKLHATLRHLMTEREMRAA